MSRGTVVRPTAATVEATGYTEDSWLVVRLRMAPPCRCRACRRLIVDGMLYAAGQEAGSPLCLACVEPRLER